MVDWATKDTFFAAPVPIEQINVAGIGHVKIYGLTAGQKDEYENQIVRRKDKGSELNLTNARATLIVMCVRDGQGRHIFTDGDIGRISQMPAAVIDPILDVIRRTSGMGDAEIEGLVKNLQPAPGPQD